MFKVRRDTQQLEPPAEHPLHLKEQSDPVSVPGMVRSRKVLLLEEDCVLPLEWTPKLPSRKF